MINNMLYIVIFVLITLIQGQRITLPFDYNWKFTTGDPVTAVPPLESFYNDSSFTQDISGMECTELEYGTWGIMGQDACKAACAAMPGCLVSPYFVSVYLLVLLQTMSQT